MTGPEHYLEAERIRREQIAVDRWDTQHLEVAIAQVHATLALAAATALGSEMPPADSHEWAMTVRPG